MGKMLFGLQWHFSVKYHEWPPCQFGSKAEAHAPGPDSGELCYKYPV